MGGHREHLGDDAELALAVDDARAPSRLGPGHSSGSCVEAACSAVGDAAARRAAPSAASRGRSRPRGGRAAARSVPRRARTIARARPRRAVDEPRSPQASTSRPRAQIEVEAHRRARARRPPQAQHGRGHDGRLSRRSRRWRACRRARRAALTMVRSARAMRPCLPITLPTSSLATDELEHDGGVGLRERCTWTSSGSVDQRPRPGTRAAPAAMPSASRRRPLSWRCP